MKHYPVMLPEVLEALNAQAGETYIDGTFGNGGYSEAILKSTNCNVIGLDRDPNVKTRADELSSHYDGRFELIETPFSKMAELELEPVDAVVLDIGVSSMQLDQGERGFSFQKDGPLDMRMSQSGPSAADAVALLSKEDLTKIFRVYGEEKRARLAATIIDRGREKEVLVTTEQLATLLEDGLGRTGKIHPATRVFQALRIFINDELGELLEGLSAAEKLLKPGGRLIVVTFHSLEDRIVKTFLRQRSEDGPSGSRYLPVIQDEAPVPSFRVDRRSVIKPSKTEIAENPRSRSAKLRWAIRTKAEQHVLEERLLPLAPRVTDYRWLQ